MTTQAILEPFTPYQERWGTIKPGQNKINPEKVIDIAANYFGLNREAIKGRCRRRELSFCRFIIYKILYRHTRMTQEELGRLFNRDRTSIITGVTALTGWMEIYPEIRNHFETIEKIVLEDE